MFAAQFNKEIFPNLNYNPIWDEAKADYDREGHFYYEIPFQNIKQKDIEKGTSYSFDKLVITAANDAFEFSITHFYDIDTKTNPVNFKNITTKEFLNFSGIITEYNLNKEAIESKFYKNGKDTYNKISVNKESNKNDLLLSIANDNGDGEGEVTIFFEYECLRDCFTILNTQGEIEQYYGCGQWTCSVTSYTVVGSGGNGSTNSSTSYHINEKVDEIDDSKLVDPKIKCLNDNLTSDGNSFVKNILKNFQGDTDIDIKIESVKKVYGPSGEEANATTSPVKDNVITIKIGVDRSNERPALGVVRTLIHEYIHADMFRKLYNGSDLHKNPNFYETYNKYKKEKFKATPQHNTMAELYVTEMKNALKNFHKNVLVGDYNYLTNRQNPINDNYYEALAWQGLNKVGVETEAYKKLPTAKKDSMKASLAQFNTATTKNCPNN